LALVCGSVSCSRHVLTLSLVPLIIGGSVTAAATV
jgi:hypothetical protein